MRRATRRCPGRQIALVDGTIVPARDRADGALVHLHAYVI